MTKRYHVDVRRDCVVVLDQTQAPNNRYSLHRYSDGVVFYRHKKMIARQCENCGHTWEEYGVDPRDIEAAEAECEWLESEWRSDLDAGDG